jgi:hypothetical protein
MMSASCPRDILLAILVACGVEVDINSQAVFAMAIAMRLTVAGL